MLDTYFMTSNASVYKTKLNNKSRDFLHISFFFSKNKKWLINILLPDWDLDQFHPNCYSVISCSFSQKGGEWQMDVYDITSCTKQKQKKQNNFLLENEISHKMAGFDLSYHTCSLFALQKSSILSLCQN